MVCLPWRVCVSSRLHPSLDHPAEGSKPIPILAEQNGEAHLAKSDDEKPMMKNGLVSGDLPLTTRPSAGNFALD